MDGVTMIAVERRQQVTDEAWYAEHDDAHDGCELALAAACYCLAAQTAAFRDDAARYHKSEFGMPLGVCGWWPFGNKLWKPDNDPIRNLVQAGALIAAEIDRLQRKGKSDD